MRHASCPPYWCQMWNMASMKRSIWLALAVVVGLLAIGCQPPLEIKEVDTGKADRIIDEVENKTD